MEGSRLLTPFQYSETVEDVRRDLSLKNLYVLCQRMNRFSVL